MEQNLLTYSKKEKKYYLISMVGQNILYGIFINTYTYFLQFTILIPALSVGIIVGASRIFDAFNDPVMGFIVDKTNSKWGKCRPYLLIAPALIFIVTVLCFLAPFGIYTQTKYTTLAIVWAAVTYVLWGIAYTIGDIPLWGITSLMTEDDNARNKLLASARIIAVVGMTLGYIVQPIALAIGDIISNEAMGFLIIASAFAFLGFILFQFAGLKVKEQIKPAPASGGAFDAFKVMWRNKPFRQVLLSGVLGSPKMLITVVALPLMTYYFASKNFVSVIIYMGLIGIGLFVGQYIAIGLTPKLLKKFSKRNLFVYSNLLAVIPSILIFVLYLISPTNMISPLNIGLLAICFTFVGIGLGIPIVLMSVMIADCVDYQEYMTGERPDGVFFAGQSFIAKLQAAVATFLAGIGYAAVGFSDKAIEEVNNYIAAGGIPRTNPDYQPYMMILFLLITLPAAAGYLLSVIPMWNYALDTKEHNKILQELNKRRHNQEDSLSM